MGEDLVRLRYVMYLTCSLAVALCLSVLSAQAGEPATSTIDAQVRVDGLVGQR